MRHYVRSTAAHNTVQVDQAEQSEIWGDFRVARRAKILHADMTETASGARFEGTIQAFPDVRGAIAHRRVIERTTKGHVCSIRVDDEITGRGQHQLCSRLLFHPDVAIEIESPGVWQLVRDGRTFARLLVAREFSVEWQTAPYCPEFGIRIDATQMVIRRDTVLPARLGYVLELADPCL